MAFGNCRARQGIGACGSGGEAKKQALGIVKGDNDSRCQNSPCKCAVQEY